MELLFQTWLIKNVHNSEFWSDEYGWVSITRADHHTDSIREWAGLPPGGKWVKADISYCVND